MTGFFRSSFQSRSQDQAEERLGAQYGNVLVGGLESYREQVTGDERFILARIAVEGPLEVEADLDVFTFIVTADSYPWEVGRESGDFVAEPGVTQPEKVMHARLEGLTRIAPISFAADALSSFASALFGTPTHVKFDSGRPISPAAGELWRHLAIASLHNPAIDNDLVRASVYRALATAALECFRLTGDRRYRSLSAEAGLHAYRRACQFIDDHLSLPITTADIAAAAGASEAELELAFLAHSPAGFTPREQLRRARLAAAHHDLVNGDPTLGDTVQAIAVRWGFAYPGRFAQYYRSVYHVNPKWVLDR